jgi:hypothetical protein
MDQIAKRSHERYHVICELDRLITWMEGKLRREGNMPYDWSSNTNCLGAQWSREAGYGPCWSDVVRSPIAGLTGIFSGGTCFSDGRRVHCDVPIFDMSVHSRACYQVGVRSVGHTTIDALDRAHRVRKELLKIWQLEPFAKEDTLCSPTSSSTVLAAC